MALQGLAGLRLQGRAGDRRPLQLCLYCLHLQHLHLLLQLLCALAHLHLDLPHLPLDLGVGRQRHLAQGEQCFT